MMSKQRNSKVNHVVMVWNPLDGVKSHSFQSPTVLMWFVTLMLEMITGEFNLSNRDAPNTKVAS